MWSACLSIAYLTADNPGRMDSQAITGWIDQLAGGNEQAAEPLWQHLAIIIPLIPTLSPRWRDAATTIQQASQQKLRRLKCPNGLRKGNGVSLFLSSNVTHTEPATYRSHLIFSFSDFPLLVVFPFPARIMSFQYYFICQSDRSLTFLDSCPTVFREDAQYISPFILIIAIMD